MMKSGDYGYLRKTLENVTECDTVKPQVYLIIIYVRQFLFREEDIYENTW